MTATSFCVRCGYQLSATMEFCSQCGQRKFSQFDNLRPALKNEPSNHDEDKTLDSLTDFPYPYEEEASWKTSKILRVAGLLVAGFIIITGVSGTRFFGDSRMSQSASSQFTTGEALITLTQVWDIPLSDSNGPRTLEEVTKDIYSYLSQSVGGPLSKQDIEIAFEPGNTLDSFFSRLTIDDGVKSSIKSKLLSLAG